MPLPVFSHLQTTEPSTGTQFGGLGGRIQQLWPIRTNSGRNPERPETPEGPKTPQLPLEELPANRLIIPGLSRASSTASRIVQHSTPSVTSQPSGPRPPYSPYTQPVSPTALRDIEQQAGSISSIPSTESRRFVGVSQEGQQLDEEVNVPGQRRRRARRHQERKCTFKNQRIRRKLISCIVSGLVLVVLLSVCMYIASYQSTQANSIDLGLALSNRVRNQQFSILVVLVILIDAVFFCHALIRLCMKILKPPCEDEIPNLPAMVGPNGYANPAQPIPVALARDEEAAGIESDATKIPPPAYGLWRESVVCYPPQIHP